MADIYCATCGEPWDVWGLWYDMPNWQFELFRKAAGCPCCEGRVKGDFTANVRRHMRSLENTDDPTSFALYMADVPESRLALPEWTRPADPVIKSCAEHGGILRKSLDDGALYWDDMLMPGHYLADPEPSIEAFSTIADKCYGPCCIVKCSECGTPLFRESHMTSDSYEEGASFAHPRNHSSVCVDCYQEAKDEDDARSAEWIIKDQLRNRELIDDVPDDWWQTIWADLEYPGEGDWPKGITILNAIEKRGWLAAEEEE